MAQVASGILIPEGIMHKVITVTKRPLASVFDRKVGLEIHSVDLLVTEDWRQPIIQYYIKGSQHENRPQN